MVLLVDYAHLLGQAFSSPNASLAIATVVASCTHQAISTVLFQNGWLAKRLLERPLRRRRWRQQLACVHVLMAWLFLQTAKMRSKRMQNATYYLGWNVKKLIYYTSLFALLSEIVHLCHLVLAIRNPYKHTFIGALHGNDLDACKVAGISTDDDSCPICLGMPDNDIQRSPEYILESFCATGKHLIHRVCMKTYLDTAMDFRCPICRNPLLIHTSKRIVIMKNSLIDVLSDGRLFTTWGQHNHPRYMMRHMAIYAVVGLAIVCQLWFQERYRNRRDRVLLC